MTSTRFNVGMSTDRSSSKDDKNNTSSDSESDEDYVPSSKELKNEREASEEHTDDSDEEAADKAKRIRASRRCKKRAKLEPKEEEAAEQPKKTAATATNIDDLWNEFKKDCEKLEPKILKSAETTATTAAAAPAATSSPQKGEMAKKCTSVEDEQQPQAQEQAQPTSCEPKTKTITEIFEFAGEAVEVQKEVPIDAPIPAAAPVLKPRTQTSRGRAGGAGLSSLLGQIGKKNKLSVLEKSKLDWDTFKQAEGIKEDLEKHNKGKDGYLEKQDFLQRTDLRQFELEKAMRSSSRRFK